jgi:hypothetical protein
MAHEVTWGLRYEGDFDAARQAHELARGDVGWIDEVVAIARATDTDYWWLG